MPASFLRVIRVIRGRLCFARSLLDEFRTAWDFQLKRFL
jgi:hypothetical protein